MVLAHRQQYLHGCRLSLSTTASHNLHRPRLRRAAHVERPRRNHLPHLVMKFPSSNGRIVTIKTDQKMARQCYMDNLRVSTKPFKEGNILAHVDPLPLVD
ncbi:hypothetical protein CR513_30948, partial [Mucuna pruriens]